MRPPHRKTIREIETAEQFLERHGHLRDCAMQRLDLTRLDVDWETLDVEGSLFLGCRFASQQVRHVLEERGAVLFPSFSPRPYDPYRTSLYTPEELEGVDEKIYAWYADAGKYHPDIGEALAQRVHDLAIDDALGDLVGSTPDERLAKRVVGVMGGHSIERDSIDYARAAKVGWLLAKHHFVLTGGGPGIMEAANLGAYMSGRDESELTLAVEQLAVAPTTKHPDYQSAARSVKAAYPTGVENLSVPTWFYGFEPVNLFASHIAKYFANSIREDGLLAICLHGVVFAPGSAGTVQEIFMDAAQNRYSTFDYRSPMAFLSRERWEPSPGQGIFPALLAEAKAGPEKKDLYDDLLTLSDSPDEVADFIRRTPPRAGPAA